MVTTLIHFDLQMSIARNPCRGVYFGTIQKITSAVEERVNRILNRDQAAITAESRFYDATAKLEELDAELFRELDAAFVAVLDTVISAAWRDGWLCGRNPDLLVMVAVDSEEGAA